MTDAELEALLDAMDSDRVEKKESLTKNDGLRQAICALANDLSDSRQDGILFVGVTDAGRPVGRPVAEQMLLTLAAMRTDGNITPPLSLDVQKRTLNGGDVAVVFVPPSSSPPVKVRGRIWVRSGPSTVIASRDDERRLNEKRRFGELPPDIMPITSADLGALDMQLFEITYLPAAVPGEVLAQNDRSAEEKLMALKLAHPGPPVCPTRLGVLTVGKEPTDWVPGAYIQFLRIHGTELTDPITNATEIHGTLADMLRKLDVILHSHTRTSVDIVSAPTEVRQSDYPLVALQEIARNAVLHRSYDGAHAPVRVYWYNDRVEVLSPGGPYGQVSKPNFGLPGFTDYRNPNLAAVMKDLGYIQRYGVGIPTAQREMRGNGNPPLEFRPEDEHVAVVLWNRP